MTLYIIRREHYTVYRYGSVTVLYYADGECLTSRFEIGGAEDMDRINRDVWEAQ